MLKQSLVILLLLSCACSQNSTPSSSNTTYTITLSPSSNSEVFVNTHQLAQVVRPDVSGVAPNSDIRFNEKLQLDKIDTSGKIWFRDTIVGVTIPNDVSQRDNATPPTYEFAVAPDGRMGEGLFWPRAGRAAAIAGIDPISAILPSTPVKVGQVYDTNYRRPFVPDPTQTYSVTSHNKITGINKLGLISIESIQDVDLTYNYRTTPSEPITVLHGTVHLIIHSDVDTQQKQLVRTTSTSDFSTAQGQSHGHVETTTTYSGMAVKVVLH